MCGLLVGALSGAFETPLFMQRANVKKALQCQEHIRQGCKNVTHVTYMCARLSRDVRTVQHIDGRRAHHNTKTAAIGELAPQVQSS